MCQWTWCVCLKCFYRSCLKDNCGILEDFPKIKSQIKKCPPSCQTLNTSSGEVFICLSLSSGVKSMRWDEIDQISHTHTHTHTLTHVSAVSTRSVSIKLFVNKYSFLCSRLSAVASVVFNLSCRLHHSPGDYLCCCRTVYLHLTTHSRSCWLLRRPGEDKTEFLCCCFTYFKRRSSSVTDCSSHALIGSEPTRRQNNSSLRLPLTLYHHGGRRWRLESNQQPTLPSQTLNHLHHFLQDIYSRRSSRLIKINPSWCDLTASDSPRLSLYCRNF